MGSVTVLEELDSLAEVESLWGQMADDLPFCHPGWMLPWWSVYGHLGSVRKLFVLAVKDDQGELIGLAPWYTEQDRLGGTIVKFLGAGEVCSDYLTVLSLAGKAQVVVDQLVAWLSCPSREGLWSQLRFDCVPNSAPNSVASSSLLDLVGKLQNAQYEVCETPTDSCWRIELPGEMDEYLKRLSRNQRYQIRRAYRKHVESGSVSVELATSPEQLEEFWPHLVDLHQRRREFLGEPGCFANSNFERFLHNATIKLGQAGKAALFLLREGQKPVAVEHQLLGSSTVFAYQSGLDPERLELTPGKLANYVTIQNAIASKMSHFDFCRGDESYKSLWRAEQVECNEIRVVASRFSAEFKHRIWTTSQQLKGWMKRAVQSSAKA